MVNLIKHQKFDKASESLLVILETLIAQGCITEQTKEVIVNTVLEPIYSILESKEDDEEF